MISIFLVWSRKRRETVYLLPLNLETENFDAYILGGPRWKMLNSQKNVSAAAYLLFTTCNLSCLATNLNSRPILRSVYHQRLTRVWLVNSTNECLNEIWPNYKAVACRPIGPLLMKLWLLPFTCLSDSVISFHRGIIAWQRVSKLSSNFSTSLSLNLYFILNCRRLK